MEDSRLIDVELQKLDSMKIVLRATLENDSTKSKAEVYYGQDGLPTTDFTQAQSFASNTEAASFVPLFRTAISVVLSEGGWSEANEVLRSIKFVLMLVSDKPGVSDEYYLKDQGLTTSILDNATRFDTPGEAAANKVAYRKLLGDGELLGRMTIKPVSQVMKGSLNEAAGLIGLPANTNATQREPMYLIRFVNPDAANDIEGDITSPCWFRYYCEGDLVESMEAAEWFDTAGLAIQTSNILRAARPEDISLVSMDAATTVKLRVLGILGETPSTNGVQITFRHGVLIQVLRVVETETGGYDWSTFYQDGYQWVFEDPNAMEEETEIEYTGDGIRALSDDPLAD